MKVTDILRVKGDMPLFTIDPLDPLAQAVQIMAQKDIGSLLVLDHGDLAGMLTFREVIQAINRNGGAIGDSTPLHVQPSTTIDASWEASSGPPRIQ